MLSHCNRRKGIPYLNQNVKSTLHYVWNIVPDNIKENYVPHRIVVVKKYSVLLLVTHLPSNENVLLEIKQHILLSKKYTCNIQPQSTSNHPNSKQIPFHPSKNKHFFRQITLKPIVPYLLLCFSTFFLLFSLYHYLAHQTVKNSTSNLSAQTSLPFSTTPTIAPVHSIPTFSSIPTATVSIVPTLSSNHPTDKPAQSPAPSGCILNISNTPSKTTSSLTNHLSTSQSPDTITILFASSCQFTSFQPFTIFPNLKELYLSNNFLTSDNAPVNFSKLSTLVASNCNLKDIRSFSKWKNLKILDLSHNLNLKYIRTLSSLKHLQYLIVTNTNVSKREIVFLKSKLPQCNIIY